VARRRRSRKGRLGAGGIAIALVLALAVAWLARDHWPWVAGAAGLAAAIWIWRRLGSRRFAAEMAAIDAMNGHEFERYLVRLFRRLGYRAEHVGAGGGDFGADVVIEKDGARVAVQAKNRESGRVGNDAVQQAIAGSTYYGCHAAMVATNSTFTRAARQQADRSSIPVTLWSRRELERAVREASG